MHFHLNCLCEVKYKKPAVLMFLHYSDAATHGIVLFLKRTKMNVMIRHRAG